MPMILGAAVKKAQKNYEQHMSGNQPQKPVGEVTIENIPKKSKEKKADSDAEYVDFEEVKE